MVVLRPGHLPPTMHGPSLGLTLIKRKIHVPTKTHSLKKHQKLPVILCPRYRETDFLWPHSKSVADRETEAESKD